METTLRMFYARALTLLAFAFLIMILLASAAFAQDAAPAPAETDIIGLIFSSAAAGAASLVAVILAAITPHIPVWIRAVIDAITTKEALGWEALIDSALDRAEAYARTKFDAVKDRPGYLNAMVVFLHTYNREIVQWADKNGNGIIDLLEARLPPVEGGKKSPPIDPVQTLMAATARRGVSKTKEPAH